MPANTLFDKPIVRLTVKTEDLAIHGDPGFRVWISTGRDGEVDKTIVVYRLKGLEVDFYSTLIAEAHSAWMYGTRRDVLRATQAVMKQARAHALKHELAGRY